MGAISVEEQQQNIKLDAAWQAQPKVADLKEAIEAFAWRENLKWDAEGMSRAAAFVVQWKRENGHLPPSGILSR